MNTSSKKIDLDRRHLVGAAAVTATAFWARRYGEAGVHALTEELRRLRWRATRD